MITLKRILSAVLAAALLVGSVPAALAADIGEPGVRTLLAVSHGSASRQLIRATLPAGAEYPKRLPNCAVMVFDFDEEARRFTFCGLHDPAAITG